MGEPSTAQGRPGHGASRSCAVCDQPGVAPINRRRRGRQPWLCRLHYEVYIELSRSRLRRGLDEALRRVRRRLP